MCVAFLQPYKSTGGRRVEFPPYLGGRSWSANTDFFASMNSYLPPLIPFHQPTAACSVKWLFIVCHSVSPLSPIPSKVVHCVSFRQPTASYSVSCPLCAIPSAHCLLFRQMVVHCVPFRQPTASYIPSNGCSLCAIPSAHCRLFRQKVVYCVPFRQPTAACSVKWLFIVCHSVKPKPPFRQRVVHCVPFHQPTASYIPSNVH